MSKIEDIFIKAIQIMKDNKIGYFDFEQKDGTSFLKIKITKPITKQQKDKNIKKDLQIDLKKETKEKNPEEINLSLERVEDLGGVKLKYIDDNKFYISSTLVGTIKLEDWLNKETEIEANKKIGEIEILNIKHPIELNFKFRIMDIFVKQEDWVDFGKDIILAERI